MGNDMPRPAFLLAMLCLAAVWLIAGWAGGAAFPFDRVLMQTLHPASPDGWVTAAWYATWLGDWIVLVPLGLAGAGWLVWQGRRRDALVLVLALGGVRLLVGLQKQFVGRVRPDVTQYMTETSFSFPSGHSANSAATFLALALLLTGSPLWRSFAVVLVFLVGLSRVVLGVHWPSDVLGGWAFGALAALAVALASERVRPSAANGGSARSG